MASTDTIANWQDAINYCIDNPGQFFVHRDLTLRLHHGTFRIDTKGKSEFSHPTKILEFLNRNYTF